MDVAKAFVCDLCKTAPLVTKVTFFEGRYRNDRCVERQVALRTQYRPSFRFVLRCLAAIVRLHRRTALNLRFPRATR